MVFLLKGSDISLKTLSFFRTAEKKVNSRFMECLEYRTPDEVLLRCRKQKEARGFCNEKRNGERSN